MSRADHGSERRGRLELQLDGRADRPDADLFDDLAL
jgi:hypothetical protein